MTISHSKSIIDRSKRNQCWICGRMERGLGFSERNYAKNSKKEMRWACSSECQSLLRELWDMDISDLNKVEQAALEVAGGHAGRYLEKLGKTDVTELTKDQWHIFLSIILTQFGAAMHEKCDRTPPERGKPS